MKEFWKVIRFANGKPSFKPWISGVTFQVPTRVSPVGLHKDIDAAREQLQALEDSSGAHTKHGRGKLARQFAIIRQQHKSWRWYNSLADKLMEQFGTLAPTAIA